MDAHESLSETPRSPSKPRPVNNSLMIVISSLVIGFSLGAGRWKWLGQEVSRISSSLGTFMFACLSQSFQQHNAQLYKGFRNVTHEMH